MATSRRYRKDDYTCKSCGKSIESWSRQKQDDHEEMHQLEEIEQKKQQKLF